MFSSPIPLYHQVSVVLRSRILDGVFDERGLLPSEKQLEAEFGVSRISVRKAVDLLEAEGLVVRKPGRGTIVHRPLEADPSPTMSHGPFENLLAMGYATEVDVLDFSDVAATATVAVALGLDTGAPVRQNIRVRSYNGRPFSYLTAWVPEDLAERITFQQLREQPLLKLLEQAGAVPDRARQEFSATSADPKVARALDVGVSSPLLSIKRIVHDAHDRAIEYLEALYRPDRYRYISTLSRNTHHDGPFWLTQPEDQP